MAFVYGLFNIDEKITSTKKLIPPLFKNKMPKIDALSTYMTKTAVEQYPLRPNIPKYSLIIREYPHPWVMNCQRVSSLGKPLNP